MIEFNCSNFIVSIYYFILNRFSIDCKASKTNKMHRIRELKNCFIIFYLFGQTSFFPTKNKNEKLFKYISYLPKIVYFSILLCSVYLIIFHTHKGPKLGELNSMFSSLMIIIVLSSNYFAFYLSARHPYFSQEICEQYAILIKYFEDYLKIKIELRDLKRKLWWYAAIVIIIEISAVLNKYLTISLFYEPITDMFVSIALFYRVFVALHAIFYISLLQVMLIYLNKTLEALRYSNMREHDILLALRHVSYIQTFLGDIVGLLNLW